MFLVSLRTLNRISEIGLNERFRRPLTNKKGHPFSGGHIIMKLSR